MRVILDDVSSSGVLHCNYRLRREILQQRDLLVSEWRTSRWNAVMAPSSGWSLHNGTESRVGAPLSSAKIASLSSAAAHLRRRGIESVHPAVAVPSSLGSGSGATPAASGIRRTSVPREPRPPARSPSITTRPPEAPPHRVCALSRIASKTGIRSPSEELMTCDTSAVAVCSSGALVSSASCSES